MSVWLDIQEFSYSDVRMIDGSPPPSIQSATNSSGSISAPIAIAVDYFVLDSRGSQIVDNINSPLSLEP